MKQTKNKPPKFRFIPTPPTPLKRVLWGALLGAPLPYALAAFVLAAFGFVLLSGLEPAHAPLKALKATHPRVHKRP
jgi:hypothetical protein